jgi:hypothetical protein
VHSSNRGGTTQWAYCPVFTAVRRSRRAMTHTRELASILETLWVELIDGPSDSVGPFMLNSGDMGLLRFLDALSADQASRTSNEGATAAAQAQHVRLGLSLMNRWASEGRNPFADPTWDNAWKIGAVEFAGGIEIKAGLRDQPRCWLEVRKSPRDVADVELTGNDREHRPCRVSPRSHPTDCQEDAASERRTF